VTTHRIPKYLESQGCRIIPVSGHEREIPGIRSRHTPIDVVDVFRPAYEAPAIARDGVAAGVSALWLQLGIVSEEAAHIAREA
jgi:predicted CoA-binding protein